MYVVLRVPPERKGKADEVLSDDLVSRQSIAVRDARSLGMTSQSGILILIEGEEGAVRRAEELLQGVAEKLPEGEAAKAYEQFRKDSEDMASGIGLVFGG
jgi:hypothetical protein